MAEGDVPRAGGPVSDVLSRLARRARRQADPPGMIRPRLPSLFEPVRSAGPTESRPVWREDDVLIEPESSSAPGPDGLEMTIDDAPRVNRGSLRETEAEQPRLPRRTARGRPARSEEHLDRETPLDRRPEPARPAPRRRGSDQGAPAGPGDRAPPVDPRAAVRGSRPAARAFDDPEETGPTAPGSDLPAQDPAEPPVAPAPDRPTRARRTARRPPSSHESGEPAVEAPSLSPAPGGIDRPLPWRREGPGPSLVAPVVPPDRRGLRGPALPSASADRQPPVVRVTIGRVDVRMVPPPTPDPARQSPSGPREPALSLDAYLERRRAKGR
jgi:hypothetical protein